MPIFYKPIGPLSIKEVNISFLPPTVGTKPLFPGKDLFFGGRGCVEIKNLNVIICLIVFSIVIN